MAATLVNLSGFTFGLQDEVGINIEQFQEKTSSKKIEVPNALGHARGVVYYDQTVEVTFSGEVTGPITYEIGDALTLANLIALGGVASGAVLLHEITYTKTRDKLAKADFAATRYPGVTATPAP